MKKYIIFALTLCLPLIGQQHSLLEQQFETEMLIKNNKELLSDLFNKVRLQKKTIEHYNKESLINSYFVNDDSLLLVKDHNAYYFLKTNSLEGIAPTVSTESQLNRLIDTNESKLKQLSKNYRFDHFPSFTYRLIKEAQKNNASVSKSPNNKLVARSLSNDNRSFDLINYKGIPLLNYKHDQKIESLTFSNNSKWLVLAGGNSAKFFHLEPLINLQEHVFNLPIAQLKNLIYLVNNPGIDISRNNTLITDFYQFDSQLQRILEKKYCIATPSSKRRAQLLHFGSMMAPFLLETLGNNPHEWGLPWYEAD